MFNNIKNWLGRLLFNLIKNDLELFLENRNKKENPLVGWQANIALLEKPRYSNCSFNPHRTIEGYLEVKYFNDPKHPKKACIKLPERLTGASIEEIKSHLLKLPESCI